VRFGAGDATSLDDGMRETASWARERYATKKAA
jgi:hypothetical protein